MHVGRSLFLSFFLALLLVSCAGNQPEPIPAFQAKTLIQDSIRSLPSPAADTLVSTRMVGFATYMDSLGYSCDSVRFLKTNGLASGQKRLTAHGYLFYTGSAREFMKAYGRDKFGADTSEVFLDNLIMGKCLSSVSYFYTGKKPFDQDSRGKWFVDGLLDEWKFQNAATAKAVAEELGKKVKFLFPNNLFLVGYVNNCVYSLTTRSSRFENLETAFFRHFIRVNKGICAN
ncbi:MAG TPA: hypothetical protein VNZ86_14865 [Bacteroidia bacterium]|jgi:hypothetical protein|nr:hypothetical protein [Bacteroidia bacterium]